MPRKPEVAEGQLSLAEVAALPVMLNTRQAAMVMGVSRPCVIRMCEEGMLDAWRLPGRESSWRIVTASLIERCGLTRYVDEVRSQLGIAHDGSTTRSVGRVTYGAGGSLASVGSAPAAPAERPTASRAPESEEVARVRTKVAANALPRSRRSDSPAATAEEVELMPELVTVEQAALILGKSTKTVRRYAARLGLETTCDERRRTLLRKDELCEVAGVGRGERPHAVAS